MISVSGKRPGVAPCRNQDDVGLAGAREVVVLLHRAHLRAREALDDDAAAGILFQACSPI